LPGTACSCPSRSPCPGLSACKPSPLPAGDPHKAGPATVGGMHRGQSPIQGAAAVVAHPGRPPALGSLLTRCCQSWHAAPPAPAPLLRSAPSCPSRCSTARSCTCASHPGKSAQTSAYQQAPVGRRACTFVHPQTASRNSGGNGGGGNSNGGGLFPCNCGSPSVPSRSPPAPRSAGHWRTRRTRRWLAASGLHPPLGWRTHAAQRPGRSSNQRRPVAAVVRLLPR
jgi:hypothetical protein